MMMAVANAFGSLKKGEYEKFIKNFDSYDKGPIDNQKSIKDITRFGVKVQDK